MAVGGTSGGEQRAAPPRGAGGSPGASGAEVGGASGGERGAAPPRPSGSHGCSWLLEAARPVRVLRSAS